MLENIGMLLNKMIAVFAILCFGIYFVKLFSVFFGGKYAPTRSVKARVSDKYVAKNLSRFYGAALKEPHYVVVFEIGKKKRSFVVSEFSYNGYKINKRGTLKYKGNRLIDFR